MNSDGLTMYIMEPRILEDLERNLVKRQAELGFSSFFARVLANRLIIFHSEPIFRLMYQKSMFVFCRILESKKAKQL